LDVHHILPIRYFEEENYKEANKLSNLISLCEVCHTTAEHICKYGTISTWSELKPLLLSRIDPTQSRNLKGS
jgi:predicted HNH restriction endonuclease